MSVPHSALLHDTPTPTDIRLHTASRVMELLYPDGRSFRLNFEFLRVHSPSAEVQGHGPGQEKLQMGKDSVNIVAVEPVGTYGIQPRFSDGHDTGIYSWQYLYELGLNHERLWAEYLDKVRAAGGQNPDSHSGGCRSGCGH